MASTSAERAPRTLFVTNDFPPRIGGAQSYYWGAIRTLDPSEVTVLAPAHVDAAAFDATHPYTVVRASTSVLWPTPAMLRTVAGLAEKVGAELLQLGHPLPAGLLGPQLKDRCGLPYVVFLGGAEVTLPGAVPGVNSLLAPRARQGGDAPDRQRVHRPRRLPPGARLRAGRGAAAAAQRGGVLSGHGRRGAAAAPAPGHRGRARRLPRPPGAAQGPGQAHRRPGAAAPGVPATASGAHRRGTPRHAPLRPRPAPGGRRARPSHRRARRLRRHRLAARRRPVRFAVPNALGRLRGGGLRHRLRGGRADRPAGDRRPLRRRARGRGAGRDRHGGGRRLRAAGGRGPRCAAAYVARTPPRDGRPRPRAALSRHTPAVVGERYRGLLRRAAGR